MQQLLSFLKKHHDRRSPLLLALSGGSDSLALWSMLIEAKKIYPFQLHVAHVDHGWRVESASQAADLENLVGQPFHTIRLANPVQSEKEARLHRLCYFRQLQEEWGFQAVLFAHHADDQAETVLKRVLEGSHLAHLGGMAVSGVVEGVTCWRPLLSRTKKELEHFLEHAPFWDSTNEDITFLRNRMRLEMVPFLEKSFGKNICKNLARLGERVHFLKDYLDYQIKKYEDRVTQTAEGLLFDFTGLPVETALEWEWLIKKKAPGLTDMQRIMDALTSGALHHRISGYGIVDRYRFFWLEEKQTSWQAEESVHLQVKLLQSK